MPIQGTIITRAGQRTSREDGAALREARKREALQHEGARQALYRVQHLKGQVQAAEGELARIRREASYLDAQIEEAREVGRRTGHLAANLHMLSFTAAEMPELVAAAEDRVKTAQHELDAAQAVFDAANEIQAQSVTAPASKMREARA